MAEFESYMQMKWIHSMQMRHTKDHIELIQLQLKALYLIKGIMDVQQE
jgi:hypothetical protein